MHRPVHRTDVRFTIRALIAALLTVLVAHLLDGWAYRSLVDPRVYDRDWGRMFRVMGYVPLWALASAALWLSDRATISRTGTTVPSQRGAGTRAGLLLGSVVLGGLLAELLKLLLRRERPGLTGEYIFRAYSERSISTGGLGLPSSHAMVAFAAAAILARLFPRATPVWYLLAIGCAVTRVMSRAHFLSDVAVAAVGGWLAAALVWTLWTRRGASADTPPMVAGRAAAEGVFRP